MVVSQNLFGKKNKFLYNLLVHRVVFNIDLVGWSLKNTGIKILKENVSVLATMRLIKGHRLTEPKRLWEWVFTIIPIRKK